MGWTREANPALVTASRFSDMQAVQLNATSRAAPVKLGPPARLLHRRSHAMTESFNNARPSRSQSSSRGSTQASGQYGGVRRYATGTIRALLPGVETAGLKSAAAHAAKTKAFFQKCPDISNPSYFRLLTFGRGNRAQFSGAFRLLSIVALAIKPLARETACLPYRMLSAWLYFLAMNNLLAGQQATRRRASKTGTEEDNITPVNSTRKSKEEAPAPDWF
jgi:hypothetical protein